MARFADLLTRESNGYLSFNRFEGGLIIADAVHASLEAQGLDDSALYVEDELFIDGNNLELDRYRDILPPFNSFWIEAKSSLHKGTWIGVACTAYTRDQARDKSITRKKMQKLLEGSGIEIGEPIDYGWIINMYPISAMERGGGRLQVLCPNSMQQVMIDKEGNLMTNRPALRPADDLRSHYAYGLNLPNMAVDIMVNCAPLVLETLALMGCVNVRQETIEPEPALNKASLKRYGVPMSSYKVLVFKGRNLSVVEHKGGTHASPREHKVKRHYKWRNGKRFYVSPYLRGNPELGRVAKTYDVRPPEDDDHDAE